MKNTTAKNTTAPDGGNSPAPELPQAWQWLKPGVRASFTHPYSGEREQTTITEVPFYFAARWYVKHLMNDGRAQTDRCQDMYKTQVD